jgi:hypothetical protein
MASPAQLVRAISGATGISHPTIVDIDRRLAKAGMRSIGGRGLNAARVTALDAARLLTAVLGSPQANQSVEAVERYGQTRIAEVASDNKPFAAAELADVAALPSTHSFVDMLAALIGSATTGSLAQQLAKDGEGTIPRIEIYAFTRATRGTVRLSGLPSRLTTTAEYALRAAGKGGRSVATAEGAGDLEQSRRITERTIFALAELLAEENRHD